MLERRSRFLFALLKVSILCSVVLTYWNTMVEKSFIITNDVEVVSETEEVPFDVRDEGSETL